MSPPAYRSLTLTNDLAEIPRLAEAVEAFCTPLQPTIKDVLAIQLALEESITNIITHGYKDAPGGTRTFTVELAVAAPNRIRATITDDAPAYDPLARPEIDVAAPLEDRPIGGLGVHLVKHLMSASLYARQAGKNILTLERQLHASS